MTATSQEQLEIEDTLAEQIYERLVRPRLRPEDHGKFVAVALDVDDYEVDSSDFAAIDRLRSRRPNSRLWLMRTGPSSAYRLRGHKSANRD